MNNDFILKEILETALDCDKIINDYIRHSSLIGLYESDNDLKDDIEYDTGRLKNMMLNVLDKILRVIAHIFDGIGKLFGSSKDHISVRDLRKHNITEVVVNDFNEEKLKENRIQCKLIRKAIDKIVKTGVVDEGELDHLLNSAAQNLSSKEGKAKIRAGIRVAYMVQYSDDLKRDVKNDYEYIKSLKNIKLKKDGKVALAKLMKAYQRYNMQSCQFVNEYFKEYNKLSK